VAIGVGTTRADGTWGPVQLSDPFGASHAVGDDRDILSVGYSQGGPGTDVVLTGNGGNPFTQAGWTGWYALDSGFRVTSTARGGRVLVAPCSQTGVLRLRIAGALRLSPVATCDPEANASRTVTGALGSRSAVMLASNDNRGLFGENPYGALVRLTVQAGEPNSVASLQNSQIPYDPTGFPTCTGDLENGGVACSGLVPRARYSLIRRRSGAVLHVAAGRDGVVRARGFRGGLRGGDVVALRNSGGRILTRLHVAHLRVDIDGAQTVLAAGTCESGDYYGTGLSDVPTSQAAVVLGVAGTGQVCPLSGDATGLSSNRIQQTDDFSGGLTQTRVPSIGATSPGDDATVYGSFVALANAVLPGPHGAVLSAHARAALTITPGAGGKPVFHSRNVNTPTGVRVFGLAPGVYRATWVVVDANGDTRTTRTRFIQA